MPATWQWFAGARERLRPFYRPTWTAVRSRLIFDTNTDYRNAVFLSASARTGSTWVAETLNFRKEYRYLFEPITLRRLLVTDANRPLLPGPSEGVVAHSVNFHVKDRPPIESRLQYIRPSDEDPRLVAMAQAVLSGRYRHPEVDQYNYTTRMRFGRRLIKETRCNLITRWLYERFPGLKIVLLVRHPLPTIQSRSEGAGEDDADMRQKFFRKLVFGQPDLVTDHLEPFRDVLDSARSDTEQRMAVWCIQHYVPLRQFAPGEVHVTFYEDFCVDPISALRRLFAFTGDPTDDASLGKALARLTTPSSTVHARTMAEIAATGRVDGMEQISKWQARATKEQLDTADRMLRAFGLHTLYSPYDPLPQPQALAGLMRRP